MANNAFDLIVIGAGPGGYVAAIRAAQLGMHVACVEREYLGGTCLNVGCIPSKAMLDSTHRLADAQHHLSRRGISVQGISVDLPAMMKFKTDVVKKMSDGVGFLFRKNNITHIAGAARIASAGNVEVTANDDTKATYSAGKILIATGSAPISIKGLPFDGKYVLSSTEALSIPAIPKKLIVVGGGYIGVELGSVWARLGSDVHVIEFLDRILPPSDTEMALALQKLLQKQGLKFQFNTTAESVDTSSGTVKLKWKSGDQTGVEEADAVLVAVGRRPVTDGLGLAEAGVATDARGYVIVNGDFQTSVPGIYAIGDVIGGLMLAHKAEEEGIAAVERMAGHAGHVNYGACPSVVYTHPELAAVGLTEQQAAARGPIKIGKFPLAANGRARGMDEPDGLVKIIGDAKTDRLLGVHILSAHASDMIAEATIAIEFAASVEDLARAFHAHPTLPEAIKEAALAADKGAIHI
jgi:dihydrolipoamide dehydrogenase